MLKMTREAAHPNMKPLLDCYHFWAGPSKLEDLDLIRSGEIGHVHFQDTPDMPRELLDQTSRFIAGDGVAPLDADSSQARRTRATPGPLSVELFLPKFQQGDPVRSGARSPAEIRSGHAAGACDVIDGAPCGLASTGGAASVVERSVLCAAGRCGPV